MRGPLGTIYPIPVEDYPKLLRYKVTQRGVHYIEDLLREIYLEKHELSMNQLTQMGLLLKTYVCQTKRVKDEVLFQDISKRAKKCGQTDPGYLTKCLKHLIMRGLIGPNPKYDPQIAISMRKKETNTNEV